MAQLKFKVRHQYIERTDDFYVVAKSVDYLYAKFTCSEEWTGAITAQFKNDASRSTDPPYEVILDENNECQVPWEVLQYDNSKVSVTVFCGDLITANAAVVPVYKTAYSEDGESSHEPTPSVYAQIVDRLNKVENLEVEAETLPAGSEASVEKTVDPETGGYVFEFGIPNGQDGYTPTISVTDITGGHQVTITNKTGSTTFNIMDGADGVSPVVSVQDITGGHRVTVTDRSGDHTFNVMDGDDGFSPTVSVEAITNGHRITVTDAEGDTTFEVMDGRGITNTVLNSDYTLTITFTDGTSYTTPSIRGTKGDTGNGIQSIAKTGTSGLVDTYTITYTDGQTTTFDVTNGETPTVDAGDVPYDDTESYPDGSVGDGLSSVKADFTKLESLDIKEISGNSILTGWQSGYYSTSSAVTNVDVNTRTQNRLWISAYTSCSEGDIFYVTNYGTSSARNWAFLDSNGNILSRSGNGALISQKITAPANSATVIFNAYTLYDYVVIFGEPLKNRTALLETELENAKTDINQLSESIAPVESTTTATAAHAVGELFMMGETLLVALSAIAVGDTITTDGGSPNAAVTTLSGEMIKDVQVNGTSIVNQGVANVPIADVNTHGVVRPGDGLIVSGTAQLLRPNKATSAQCKTGTHEYNPVTPIIQHAATFYGLAKAASDTTQSASSNPVGTYTDAAKIAIQKMLGIYEAPWELIREDTFTNASSAAYDITVDGNGNPFALTDLILYIETPVQATEAKLETYGWIDVYYGDSSFYTLELGAWTQSANAAAHGAFGILERVGNLLKIEFTKQNTSGQHETIGIRYQTNDISRAFILNGNREFVKIKIRSIVGTAHYIVYGKRAWS